MADVIQVAKERRSALAAEVAKLDEFIQMAEALMKWHESRGDKASNSRETKAGGPGEAMMLRTGSSLGGAAASAT